MRNFTDWVNDFFPTCAIRVIVGDTEIYLGRKCNGLKEMRAKEIEWLNNHKIISYAIIPYSYEVVLKYRASRKFKEIVFG